VCEFNFSGLPLLLRPKKKSMYDIFVYIYIYIEREKKLKPHLY
jgi:hypothetical protein